MTFLIDAGGFRRIGLCGVAWVAIAAGAAADTPPELQAEVSKLLDVGWKRTSKSLQDAQAHFASNHEGLKDARFDYAHALVLMKHRKYAEAQRLLTSILTAQPANLAARRAKIWVDMLTKDYDAALAEIDALARSLSASSAADDRSAHEEAAAYMGRIFGYFEGPAAGAIPDHALQSRKEKLLERLDTLDKQEFEAGLQAVLDQYAELALNREQSQADTKAKGEAQRERDRVALDRDRDAALTEQKDLDKRADDLRARSAQELAAIDRKLQPVQASLADLDSQYNYLRRQILFTESRIAQLLTLANETTDPTEAAQLRYQARVLDANRIQDRASLGSVQSQIDYASGQLSQLQYERNGVVASQQRESNQLQKRANTLSRTVKRIKGDEQRLTKPITGVNPKSLSLSAQANAFSTYEEFPFEVEKQRLLDSLR